MPRLLFGPYNCQYMAGLIVQKYGGTSVGSVERIKNVARRVARWRADGNGLDDIPVSTNAVLLNGATFGPGVEGQAFVLDGVNDSVPHARQLVKLLRNGEPVKTRADIEKMMQDPRYWNPARRDPAFIKEVQDWFEKNTPKRGRQ